MERELSDDEMDWADRLEVREKAARRIKVKRENAEQHFTDFSPRAVTFGAARSFEKTLHHVLLLQSAFSQELKPV
jgi:hypothetical protein